MSFFFTKFFMRFIGLIALLGFLGVLYYAYQTEVNYTPIEGIAPFTEEPVENISPFYKSGNDVVDYTMPHRSDKELQSWITTVVSDALYIPNKGYQRVVNQVNQYFDSTGKAQYLAYLQQAKVEDYIDRSNYNLNVLVDDTPIVLNAKNIDGFHRWLYQVPVTISFVPVGVNSFAQGQQQTVTQKLTLIVQIRRTDTTDDNSAMLIESWNMRARR